MSQQRISMLGPRSKWVTGGQRGVPQKGSPPPWACRPYWEHCAQGLLTSYDKRDQDRQEHIQRSSQEAEGCV